MITVELHQTKYPKPKKPNNKAYQLRWRGHKLNPKTGALIYHGKIIGDVGVMEYQAAEKERRTLEGKINNGIVPADPPVRLALGDFLDDYKAKRQQGEHGVGHLKGAPKLSKATITDHSMTLRYMVQHFGRNYAINSIELQDAIGFIDALESGQLAAARKESRRLYKMGPQTVRGHIRNAKAIFNWVLRLKLITENPFVEFNGRPFHCDPNHYVTLRTFRQVFNAAPSPGWRVMFSLCRLAGLRRNAARTLPWAGSAEDSEGRRHWVGVDWQRHRLCLVGNHKTRRSYREVPIRPVLYRILLRAYDAAPAGSVTASGLTPNNLTRRGKAIVTAAGTAPWPKLFQAMRSSCENDWKLKGVAEATYTHWMGHSSAVSRESYVAPTELEYAAISGLRR